MKSKRSVMRNTNLRKKSEGFTKIRLMIRSSISKW
jgi:hypothetical protein